MHDRGDIISLGGTDDDRKAHFAGDLLAATSGGFEAHGEDAVQDGLVEGRVGGGFDLGFLDLAFFVDDQTDDDFAGSTFQFPGQFDIGGTHGAGAFVDIHAIHGASGHGAAEGAGAGAADDTAGSDAAGAAEVAHGTTHGASEVGKAHGGEGGRRFGRAGGFFEHFGIDHLFGRRLDLLVHFLFFFDFVFFFDVFAEVDLGDFQFLVFFAMGKQSLAEEQERSVDEQSDKEPEKSL